MIGQARIRIIIIPKIMPRLIIKHKKFCPETKNFMDCKNLFITFETEEESDWVKLTAVIC